MMMEMIEMMELIEMMESMEILNVKVLYHGPYIGKHPRRHSSAVGKGQHATPRFNKNSETC